MFYKEEPLIYNMKIVLEQLLDNSKLHDFLYLKLNPINDDILFELPEKKIKKY